MTQIPVRAVRRWPGTVRGRLAGRDGGFRGRMGSARSRWASESADGRGLDRGVLPVAGLLVSGVAAADAGQRGLGGPVPWGLKARGAAEPEGARHRAGCRHGESARSWRTAGAGCRHGESARSWRTGRGTGFGAAAAHACGVGVPAWGGVGSGAGASRAAAAGGRARCGRRRPAGPVGRAGAVVVTRVGVAGVLAVFAAGGAGWSRPRSRSKYPGREAELDRCHQDRRHRGRHAGGGRIRRALGGHGRASGRAVC